MKSNPVLILPEQFLSRELANARLLARRVFVASKCAENDLHSSRASQDKASQDKATQDKFTGLKSMSDRPSHANSPSAISLASRHVFPPQKESRKIRLRRGNPESKLLKCTRRSKLWPPRWKNLSRKSLINMGVQFWERSSAPMA